MFKDFENTEIELYPNDIMQFFSFSNILESFVK